MKIFDILESRIVRRNLMGILNDKVKGKVLGENELERVLDDIMEELRFWVYVENE
jgi:hypothetical protein